MRVAHLSPHLGGGVGSVFEALLESDSGLICGLNDHFVFCLDRLKHIPKGISDNLVKDSMGDKEVELTEALLKFDVVLCHYWNHPLLARFLGQGSLPRGRVLFWCHNSGLGEPHVLPNYILDSGASVVFTTPVSVDGPNMPLKYKLRPDDFHILPSTRLLSSHLEVGRNRVTPQHANRLLYVGTVSDAKMHPDSAQIFSMLSKAGLSIELVGGDQERLLEAEVASIGGRLTVHGWVDSVINFYRRSDIFIYPLRSGHYGTGEQVILEAMASGLPVVVFDNPAESAIVSHGETGFIAKTTDEFVGYVQKLADDKKLYALMSKQGIARIKEKFDSVTMTQMLSDMIEAQLSRPKIKVNSQVPNGYTDIGLHLFCVHSFFESYVVVEDALHSEDYAKILFQRIVPDLDSPAKRGVWTSQTKGSPFHYLRFFPDSVGLGVLCSLIREHLNSPC